MFNPTDEIIRLVSECRELMTVMAKHGYDRNLMCEVKKNAEKLLFLVEGKEVYIVKKEKE